MHASSLKIARCCLYALTTDGTDTCLRGFFRRGFLGLGLDLRVPTTWGDLMLDRSAVGQLSSLSSRTKWQRLPAGDTLRMYRLPAIAAIFYWIRKIVVQLLTCLTLGRLSGPAYSTGELLNTPWIMKVGLRKLRMSRLPGGENHMILRSLILTH